MFAGHRDWHPSRDPAVARIPFGPAADRLLAGAGLLSRTLSPGATVALSGEDSGWAAASLAALLPGRKVVALIAGDGPLGAAGCQRWLAASDAPANLTLITTGADAWAKACGAADARLDFTALAPAGPVAPPLDADPESLHALIDPAAPIDLHRARTGEPLLSDAETKALYWAGRAASVARTAARMGLASAEVAALLAGLAREGFVRLQRLPAAMARLHVFYATGDALLPLAGQTLGAVADHGFRRFAHLAYAELAGEGTAMSYAEAARVIARTAAALDRDGVRAGDRVCVHAIPHVEVQLVFWACVHLGAVFVPIGSIWSRDVAAGILERCRPRALFVNDEAADRVPEEWRRRAIRLDSAGAAGDAEATGIKFSDWLGVADLPAPPTAHSGADDTAIVLFTSGTTGTPKGVELSNAAFVNAALMSGRATGIGPQDRLFTVVEVVSPGPLRDTLVCTVMSGASVVVADRARRGNVLGLADICRSHRVTVFRAVPATLHRLCQAAGRLPADTFAGLRLIQSGTAPLHQSTLEGLEALSPARVMDNMGGTESAGTSFLNDLALWRGSIFVHGGYAHDCVAQTVDEAGNVIRDGTIGRVRIHSDRLMVGYLDDPGRSAEALGDGWFYSGDMARWQPDGPLRIAGRAVEMIKSAWGDMVFPSEIEAVLIEDGRVREIAASGYTDADGIERIAAFVLPGAGPAEPDRFGEELKSLVRAALGPSKVPSIVVLVAAMPRLSRDKVDKQQLVKRYLSRE